MKKLFAFGLLLGILSMACQTLMPVPTAIVTEPATAEPNVETNTGITPKLEELGGTACEENPDFTCVTIKVPLDHFDANNTETLDVVFAVLPATGERFGMFVQAFPGGPGGEGVSTATASYYSEGILEHYDLVFFDQRGIGLSSPLTCEKTVAEDYRLNFNDVDDLGEEGLDTPQEQQEFIEEARVYVEACIAEMGIAPEKLKFYGTLQVAEDIETFRQTIGDEKIWLYGVSYGTQVAQIYAANHTDRLAGLVLDGTVDLTLTGEEFYPQQEQAFEEALTATLEACNQDELCAEDMNGDAVEVYKTLAQKLSNAPITYQYPLPSGETTQQKFTFDHLETVAAYQMYSLNGRMIFLRALAEANRGDMVPMARVLYIQTTINPATQEYIGDPTFSDSMSMAVDCTDVSFFDGTAEERIAKIIETGQASNGIEHPIDGFIYFGVYCANWPSAPTSAARAEPLVAEGVPTFVLNATLDAATPFEQGQAVAARLADGYHIYVEGGVHSIYGYGEQCPDQIITDFMVNGTLPQEREIVCKWDPAVVVEYAPNLPKDVSEFADPLEMLSALDVNLYYLPEVFYGYFQEDETAGCTYGGTYTFGPSEIGDQYVFDQCSMVNGLVMTGSGFYDSEKDIYSFEVDISGAKTGRLIYTYDYGSGTTTVTGEYGGETIDLEQ